jgi:hypothetical protein
MQNMKKPTFHSLIVAIGAGPFEKSLLFLCQNGQIVVQNARVAHHLRLFKQTIFELIVWQSCAANCACRWFSNALDRGIFAGTIAVSGAI